MLILCLSYIQTKDSYSFKKWLTDKSKARRCDSCHNDRAVNERKVRDNANREAKEKLKPVETISAKSSARMNLIDELSRIREDKQIKDDFDYI